MRLLASVVCGACLLSATAQTPPAATTVDVELVLAADVSQSMDFDEHTLQRKGYVEAFRQADVIAAMLAGKIHRIAVAYVEFAGDQPPEVAIPWTIIDSEAAAHHFADRLLALPINGEPKTSISRLLADATELLDSNSLKSSRQVIMISGDGANAVGPPVAASRDATVKHGVTIVGLPITLSKPLQYYDIANLDAYFAGCVVGGRNAFVQKITKRPDFADAIRAAVSAKTPAGAMAPGKTGSVDCLAGEKAFEKAPN